MGQELRCKYCGGVIRPRNPEMGVCESCGSPAALPKLNEKTNEDLYNRADHLRRIHDYDGAISAYEHIIAENPNDPEARWNLVLCRYGVEYTYDRRTGSYIPSINRMSLDSVLEDRDYLKALENSQGEAREAYRREALRLADIQDELEKIVRENQKYDVFISFKATDDNRRRTRDYTLAQEIYDSLSADGLRVFFSPVSLREHVGEVYEPYIFAALYSAKVMVLVGTKREYLDSEWVRNEWSRYLYMTRENPEKHILPVYEEMKPEEFPAGIGRMQAISMNTVGAVELIKTRVRDYTGAKFKNVYVKDADGGTANISNVLRRIQIAVEAGDFEEAEGKWKNLCAGVQGQNPDILYVGLFVRYRAKNEKELALRLDKLKEDKAYRYLLENGSKEQKQTLTGLAELKGEAEREAREEALLKRLSDLYRAGKYEAILDKVEAAEKDGTIFRRQEEIDELYQRAAEEYENQDKLKEYKALVGDGSRFFKEQLQRKYPQKAADLKLLAEKPEAPDLEEKMNRLMAYGILIIPLFVILWAILSYRMYGPACGAVIAIVVLSCIRGIILEMPDGLGDFLLGILAGLLKTVVLPFILTIVAGIFYGNRSPVVERVFDFISQRFGDGTADTALMDIFFLLCFLLGFLQCLFCRSASRKKQKQRQEKERKRKELLDFLPEFEKQETLLLKQEYSDAYGGQWIPLKSLYKK